MFASPVFQVEKVASRLIKMKPGSFRYIIASFQGLSSGRFRVWEKNAKYFFSCLEKKRRADILWISEPE
jgi:hypothetical protein